jgi:hypothetical protein
MDMRKAYESFEAKARNLFLDKVALGFERLIFHTLPGEDASELRSQLSALVCDTQDALQRQKKAKSYTGVVWTEKIGVWTGVGACISIIVPITKPNVYLAAFMLTDDLDVVHEQRELGTASSHERAVITSLQKAKQWCEKKDALWVGKKLPPMKLPVSDIEEEDVFVDIELPPEKPDIKGPIEARVSVGRQHTPESQKAKDELRKVMSFRRHHQSLVFGSAAADVKHAGDAVDHVE